MNISLMSIITIVLVILILKFVGKILLKLLAFALLICLYLGYSYYHAWWPFQNNYFKLEVMSKVYCEEVNDPDICDCIVKKIEEDMKSRFSPSELDSLLSNKAEAAYLLRKSQQACRAESMRCLKARGAQKKYSVFMKNMIPIDNAVLNFIEEKTDSLTSKLSTGIDHLRFRKERIDKKYE